MPKPNRNDISVGKDKWITFIELDDELGNAIELDEILKPIEPYFDLLETNCVAGCCGIDAYVLWPDDIATAAKSWDLTELRRRFDDIQTLIAGTKGNAFVSHRMNNYFHKVTLLKLLNHIGFWIEHAYDVGKPPHPLEPAN